MRYGQRHEQLRHVDVMLTAHGDRHTSDASGSTADGDVASSEGNGHTFFLGSFRPRSAAVSAARADSRCSARHSRTRSDMPHSTRNFGRFSASDPPGNASAGSRPQRVQLFASFLRSLFPRIPSEDARLSPPSPGRGPAPVGRLRCVQITGETCAPSLSRYSPRILYN
jgi:hypothetical protein